MHGAPLLSSTAPRSRFVLPVDDLVACPGDIDKHGAAAPVLPRLTAVVADVADNKTEI